MCQMSVVLERKEAKELVMEGVTQLEVTEEGIRLSTFFEEPKLLPGVRVKSIDFLGGITTLAEVDHSTNTGKS